MTEWRRKKYYRTRVLIPVDEVLESEFGDCLVCLTGGELNLLRNLLQYADRRSTFVSEYHKLHYLAPSEAEWDDLQALTAHLEGSMMDCEQFTKDLQEILDWVRQQGSLSEGPFSEAESAAFPYDDVVADDELTPAEEDACDVAQLWFEWGYQIITEQVLPATRWGFDYLVPAVAGFIALAIGGPAAAMGVYAVAEFIQELLEIFYRGAETNLVNWMDTNKEDIVCVLWGYLVLGGDASTIWAAVEEAIVDPAEDISVGDKLMLHLFMGSWAGSNAQLAFTAATEWATSNAEEGFCDECDMPPLGLYWRPDADCYFDNGSGWTFYDVSHDPITFVPAVRDAEVKWQPNTADNLTLRLTNSINVREGNLEWRNRLYGPGAFGLFYTGYDVEDNVTHAYSYHDVAGGSFDWDDLNMQNMTGNAQFAYTVQPTMFISVEII